MKLWCPEQKLLDSKKNAAFHDVLTVISEERYTRYPVYEEDRDNIVGFINIKDFLTQGISNRIKAETFDLEKFTNRIIKTIETTPINNLLIKMQKQRTHIAILLDEYGGTSGLVTVEDILEEIVGEIRDEFDDDEIADIRKLKEDHYLIHSKVLLDEVATLLRIDKEKPRRKYNRWMVFHTRYRSSRR
ncbi:CBS domain-containing protein [Psychrobacillus sp. OK032]|nr:CBS domain-containing protein [Psychrobacillus sp. OK032]